MLAVILVTYALEEVPFSLSLAKPPRVCTGIFFLVVFFYVMQGGLGQRGTTLTLSLMKLQGKCFQS